MKFTISVTKKSLVLFVGILIFPTLALAGKDYSGKYLDIICSKDNTDMCEGYLLATLDIYQSSTSNNLCICGKDTVCGMSAIDTKKLPKAFLEWSKKNPNMEGYSSKVAKSFIFDVFSCNRANPNDFLKSE